MHVQYCPRLIVGLPRITRNSAVTETPRDVPSHWTLISRHCYYYYYYHYVLDTLLAESYLAAFVHCLPVLQLCTKLWAASSTDILEILRYLIWPPSAIFVLLRKIVERHTNVYSWWLSHVKLRNGRHCSVDVKADFLSFLSGTNFQVFWRFDCQHCSQQKPIPLKFSATLSTITAVRLRNLVRIGGGLPELLPKD